jgi:hypothetical protein
LSWLLSKGNDVYKASQVFFYKKDLARVLSHTLITLSSFAEKQEH